MPEHVHLLLTPTLEVTLERAIQLIKGGYSHALGTLIGRKREIWQRGFTDHRIRDEQDFLHHREYIQRNPVERGIANDPHEYRHCSAFPGYKLDAWPSAAKAGVLLASNGTSGTRALPDSVLCNGRDRNDDLSIAWSYTLNGSLVLSRPWRDQAHIHRLELKPWLVGIGSECCFGSLQPVLVVALGKIWFVMCAARFVTHGRTLRNYP